MNEKPGPKASNALKGLISGSLIIGGAINPYNVLIQIILVIVGVFVLLDALLLYGKNTHPMTTSSMAFLGAVLAIMFTITGYAHYYLTVIVFVFALLYTYFIVVRKRFIGEEEE